MTGAPTRSAEVSALFERYIALFNADDFDAAFDCYRLPFTWLYGPKAVTVASRAEFVEMMTATKAALVKKGLGKSRLLGITVRVMEAHVALAGVAVMRQDTDGRDLEEVGGTYMVHDDGTGWRFVGQAAHPVTAIAPAWEE